MDMVPTRFPEEIKLWCRVGGTVGIVVPTDILSLLYLLFGHSSWYNIDHPVGKGHGKGYHTVHKAGDSRSLWDCKPIFLPD